jgi:hypothetical protein
MISWVSLTVHTPTAIDNPARYTPFTQSYSIVPCPMDLPIIKWTTDSGGLKRDHFDNVPLEHGNSLPSMAFLASRTGAFVPNNVDLPSPMLPKLCTILYEGLPVYHQSAPCFY